MMDDVINLKVNFWLLPVSENVCKYLQIKLYKYFLCETNFKLHPAIPIYLDIYVADIYM